MSEPKWETPTEFCRRIGIRVNAFSRKVRHARCPQNFEANEGSTGRIVHLRASPELEEFMSTDFREHVNRRAASSQPLNNSTAQLPVYGKD